MRGAEYQMAATVYDGTLLLGIASPEYEHESVPMGVEFPYRRICELLPPFSLMGTGSTGPYGKGSVQQQDSLSGPSGQVSARRYRFAQVITYLLEYIP